MDGPQLVLHASKVKYPPLWREPLVFPAYFAVLSAVIIVLGIVWRSTRKLRSRLWKSSTAESANTKPEDETFESSYQHTGFFSEIKATIKAHGIVPFLLKILRLGACLALVAFTAVAFIQKEALEEGEKSLLGLSFKKGMKGGKKRRRRAQALEHAEWIEIIQCGFYVYTSLLALFSLTLRRQMRRIVALHLSVLLLVVFAVYGYRDIWPLATFTLKPVDAADGWLTWSRVSVVAFVAVLLPLITPREYVPLDPQNPNEPNGEQTASPLAMMLFSFLDITVYQAWKHPHLPYDLLPSLCDYDRAAHLRDMSADKILPVPGKKPRHLAFRLLGIFRNEFLFMAFAMTLRTILGFLSPIAVNRLLNYIETHGAEAYVRPWFWVVILFLSPVLSSILLQLYIFVSTGSLVRAEGILTQLIFEHALRIRMKEEAPKSSNTSTPNTPRAQTLDLPSGSGSDSEVDADAASTAATAVEGATTAAGSGSTDGDAEAQTSKPAEPAATPAPAPVKEEDSSSGSNLAGRINNLISTDLENITDSRDFMFLLIYAPLQTALCIWFLYKVLGWSSFVGMGLMVVGIYFPVQIGKVTHSVQVKRMKATDARVQTVTEIMGVVRMLKMFGWETKMGNQLREKREDELAWIKKRFYLSLLNQNVNWILPLLTMLLTFFTYTIIMKERLTASTVFSTLTVFDSLRDQLHFVFWTIPSLIQGKVSMDRVDEFLTTTELLDRYTEKEDIAEFVPPTADREAIGFHNAVFTWGCSEAGSTPATPSRRKFTLRIEDDLFFKKGAFNLIVGPTGSGKTSLLLALLGELHFSPPGPDSWFNLPREKGVAYAAQEPWVLNETIKDNVLFGEEFDAERYKAVLYQCALDRDLELFSAGDETEVGEKGLTLSGGQKARISLARAVYSKADILLLDDVLSALDVHTARWVVDKAFAGSLLRGRTVILITHNVAMTSKLAENVVEIASDGTVSQKESVGEVLRGNPELLAEVEQEHEAIDKAEQLVDESTPKDEPAKPSGKLIADEEIALGRVSLDAMMLYFANMGGVGFWVGFWALLLGVEFMNVVLSWWLGVWAHQYELVDKTVEVDVIYYLGYYSLFVVIALIGFSAAFFLFTIGVIRASRKIHETLVTSVLSTTLRFLDKTPIGRIVARFTRDVRAIDGPLADNLEAQCEMTAALILKLLAIVYFTPIFLWPGLAFAIVSYILGTIYIAAQLSVKREMSNARSPLFSHFGAAIGGLTSIRAYGAETPFKLESLKRVDKYTRPARAFYNLNRWIGIRVDTLGGLFSAGLAAYLVYVAKVNNASETGLQLNLAVGFTGMLLWWVRSLNELEVTGNSLERIQAYIDIEHEKPPTPQGKPPASWPTSGSLTIRNLSARYSLDGPEVLHQLTFSIASGSKVGVVGRTGSGKSSLTLGLLRLIPTGGEVVYDGVETGSMNLEDLRGAITIIPQQPELISGTIRQNLDPFDEHDDLTLNDALRSAGLFSLQKDLPEDERITLDSAVSSGGGNFSLGQRQILALARALVRQSKVLILDEATASLDHETDALVQQSLSTEFNDVTLITVAHRLQTIMNSDKILVLDAGNLVEFDSPENLLKKKDGAFKSLVDGSGDKENLYKLVKGASSSGSSQ